MLKVNQIFYSLQGEGRFTGTAAVFLRLSGCNMRCSFCDTQHEEGTLMSDAEILQTLLRHPTRHIVITGGEPLLQLTPSLTALLHRHGYFIQIETNGSVALPEGCEVDWITCSPKALPLHLCRIDELKVLCGARGPLVDTAGIEAKEYRLQPLDSGDSAQTQENLKATINYILNNPKWKLSLQTHKIIGME